MQKLFLPITLIASVGFLSNLIWEKLHIALYANYEAFIARLPLPVALYTSLVDTGIILLIYFLVSCLFRNFSWIYTPQGRHYVSGAAFGIIIALLIEQRALATGKWGYNSLMPIIPDLKVGLSPILQMVVTPIFSFWFTSKIFKTKNTLFQKA